MILIHFKEKIGHSSDNRITAPAVSFPMTNQTLFQCAFTKKKVDLAKLVIFEGNIMKTLNHKNLGNREGYNEDTVTSLPISVKYLIKVNSDKKIYAWQHC